MGWLRWTVLDWIKTERCEKETKLTQCVQVWETRKKTGQPQRYCGDGTDGKNCQCHQHQLKSRPGLVRFRFALYGENKLSLRVRLWQSRWAVHVALESLFLSKRHSLYSVQLFCLYVNIMLIKTGAWVACLISRAIFESSKSSFRSCWRLKVYSSSVRARESRQATRMTRENDNLLKEDYNVIIDWPRVIDHDYLKVFYTVSSFVSRPKANSFKHWNKLLPIMKSQLKLTTEL